MTYAPCAQLDNDVQYPHKEAARSVYSLLGACFITQWMNSDIARNITGVHIGG